MFMSNGIRQFAIILGYSAYVRQKNAVFRYRKIWIFLLVGGLSIPGNEMQTRSKIAALDKLDGNNNFHIKCQREVIWFVGRILMRNRWKKKGNSDCEMKIEIVIIIFYAMETCIDIVLWL